MTQQERPQRIETNGPNYGIFKRAEVGRRKRHRNIIAYDLETTRIKKGTPRVTYITAFGEGFTLSKKVHDLVHLKDIVVNKLLTWKNRGTFFVGWNANKFDAYFIVKALLMAGNDYIMRPMVTKSHQLRGLGIVERDRGQELGEMGKTHNDWEFLDGMAMTGYQKDLNSFLMTFAPQYHKLDIGLKRGVRFNPDNPKHVAYADRDSEGLWYALQACNRLVKKATNIHLTQTIANLGIKNFTRHLPPRVRSMMPPVTAREACYDHVMRGGFVFLQYKYKGPVWKFDLNQAYAAAMRDARLPHGRCMRVNIWRRGQVGIYRINAHAPAGNIVPFYHKPVPPEGERITALYSFDELRNTWLTSIELEQLDREGWQVEILDGYRWQAAFNMRIMVNKLERLRGSDPQGPNGPLGTMAKQIGNNSYGKLAERLNGINLVYARHCPPGFFPYRPEDPDFKYLFCSVDTDDMHRRYHRPHIAAMITAHVRMEVRRAALLGGRYWLYSDTDCVVYARPVKGLHVHPEAYGAWKQETAGERYTFITKKVYASEDGSQKHAKGMTLKNLTSDHYRQWFEGKPPTQIQLQRRNLRHVLAGADMFYEREKVGQIIKSAKTVP